MSKKTITVNLKDEENIDPYDCPICPFNIMRQHTFPDGMTQVLEECLFDDYFDSSNFECVWECQEI